MAAGDTSKNGLRVDFAIHYTDGELGTIPICKNKLYGYSTNEIGEVDCKRCLKILKNRVKLLTY